METRAKTKILARKRLIDHHNDSKSLEVFTSALWMDVLAEFFPPNSDEGWMFGPEYPYHDRKTQVSGSCDLVLSQSQAGWPKPFDAVGLPFFAAEFKSALIDLPTAKKQLTFTLQTLAKYWGHEQRMFGIIAAGNLCTFYLLRSPKSEVLTLVGNEWLDLKKAEDYKQIMLNLDQIKKASPDVTADFLKSPAVSKL